MRSGYYIYKNDKYIFELEDNGMMTVMEEKGPNLKKMFDNANVFNNSTHELQIQKVKMFPSWNDAIIFHSENLDYIGQGETIKVFAIIEFKFSLEVDDLIDRIEIHSKELDYIYDVKKVSKKLYYKEDGSTKLELNSFDEVNSLEKELHMNENTIKYSWIINREFGYKEINTCFYANAILKFKLDKATDNYVYIFDFIQKIKKFMSYLYYRCNASFNKIELFATNGKKAIMTLFDNDKDTDDEKYIKKNFIKYEDIKDIDDKILQAIIDNDIFIRHIPKDEIDRNQITTEKFVTISSAFEWEFKRLFPNGVKHRKSKLEKIEQIKNDICGVSKDYTGEKKKIVENVIDNVGKDNLESKLNYSYKGLKNISEVFLKRLCELNYIESEKYVFAELQTLRNDFSHGNMEINLNSSGYIGLIFLERFNYIMQLKRFGLKDEIIKKIINDLFNAGIAL